MKKLNLLVSVFILMAMVLSACVTAAPQPTATAVPPTAVPPTAVPAPKFKEAPMLAKLVQRGMLPPVDQRLPANPCVLPALEIE